MKKLFFSIALLFFATSVFAVDGDITDPSLVTVNPDRDHIRAVQIHAYRNTQTVKIDLVDIDAAGNIIGRSKESPALIKNIEDDPATPQDETDPKYTQWRNATNNGSNLWVTAANKAKQALGL